MELVMDETTYAVAVETTAQIEVLRTAFVVLATRLMAGLPDEGREKLLQEIEAASGSLPNRHGGIGGSTGTALYLDVQRSAPAHAQMLVQDIRQALS